MTLSSTAMTAAYDLRSRLLRCHLEAHEGFSYLLHVPGTVDPDRVLVLVHGINRKADYMMYTLAEHAERHHYTLVAPVFDYRYYEDYQRLGRCGRGQRADLALRAALDDLVEQVGIARRFHLFGFSGGAQFAHRFVYAWPDDVRSATFAAAGWYTAPDPGRRFPYGTAETKKLPGLRFDASKLASTPTLTLVGERDKHRGSALRRAGRVDRVQGRSRLARARWFHRAIRSLADANGLAVEHSIEILDKTAHDFGQAVYQGGLADKLFAFCERHTYTDS